MLRQCWFLNGSAVFFLKAGRVSGANTDTASAQVCNDQARNAFCAVRPPGSSVVERHGQSGFEGQVIGEDQMLGPSILVQVPGGLC